VTRRNILTRDLNACQYCGVVFPSSSLTLDHVLPQSRGGRGTWENLLTCCHSCNRRKRDRTPEEAGMALIRMPRRRCSYGAQSDEDAGRRFPRVAEVPVLLILF